MACRFKERDATFMKEGNCGPDGTPRSLFDVSEEILRRIEGFSPQSLEETIDSASGNAPGCPVEVSRLCRLEPADHGGSLGVPAGERFLRRLPFTSRIADRGAPRKMKTAKPRYSAIGC